MRVVIISKTFVLSPAQRLLEWLAGTPNLDLTLITPQMWRGDDGVVIPFVPIHTVGYRVVCCPLRWNGRYHLYTYRGLGAILDRLHPDLLHIDEEPYNPAAWQGVWQARRLGILAMLVAWQNVLRHYPPPYSCLERWVYRQAAGLVAGNAAAAAVVRTKGYPGRLAIFSLHGVDPDLWPPRAPEPPAPQAPFTVGYVGRLVPEKGVDLLLRALAELPPRVRLVVVGRGPAERDLQALAASLRLEDRVAWVGPLPANEIPAVMRSFDALTLPSRARPGWTEQFGRVLVEAMASGVPVIGSAAGEIPQVIGDAGLVVAEGDYRALGAAIARLASEPELWRSLAQRGPQRCRAQFTQAAIATQLADLYATILKTTTRDTIMLAGQQT